MVCHGQRKSKKAVAAREGGRYRVDKEPVPNLMPSAQILNFLCLHIVRQVLGNILNRFLNAALKWLTLV